MKTPIVPLLLSLGLSAFIPIQTHANPAAEQAYQEGLAHLKNPGVKPVEKALESFKKAVALDPKFAAAHAQIAMAYCSLGDDYNYWSPERTRSQSLQAVERALALNPQLAEAHLAAALAKAAYQWDWAGAEQAFKRATSLQPATSDAFLAYAFFLADMGRAAEADALFQKAQALGVPPSSAYSYKVARTTDRKELTQLIESQQKQLEQSSPTAYGLWNQAYASCKARNWAAGEKYLLQQIPLMGSIR